MNNLFSEDQISMIFQNIPKYMYIKISLINKLKSGELVEGDKLSTEKELCENYGCSRLTVRKALDELMQEGYIYKIQGRGTYVKNRIPQKQNLQGISSCSLLIRSQNMTPSKTILHKEIVPASAFIAEKFGIPENSPVLEYERVYYADGTPVIYSKSYFNASLLPHIEQYDLQDTSIISLIKEKYNLEIVCLNRELRAVISDEHSSKLLNLPEKFPLLQVIDLKGGKFQDQEIPIEYYTFLYVTERIRYSPEL